MVSLFWGGARNSGDSLNIGPSRKQAILNMPVRSRRKGTLTISSYKALGYHLAPNLGNVEILLQPRIKVASIVDVGDHVVNCECDDHELSAEFLRRCFRKICPVQIGDYTRLESRVNALKRVAIGSNSVVAAGSVVAKSCRPISLFQKSSLAGK